jgi:ribonuclease T2
MNLLNTYWPSYDGSNTDFWTHEYEKHGTCAEVIPQLGDELKFFTVTVQLLQKYNVIPLLAAGGITPQDGVSVSLSDAQSAVEQSFGYKPQFNCKSGMMESAILCFDKSLNPTECTGLSSQCDSSFIIPQSQQP